MKFDIIESPALIFGGLGAVLVAFPTTVMYGFGSWLIGNSLWIYHGWKIKDLHVVVLFGFYLMTASASLLVHGGVV